VTTGEATEWGSGSVSERAYCVLAPNPGPMTLEGTNTWVLLEPGSTEAVVVDPGPLHLEHLEAVLRAASDRGIYLRDRSTEPGCAGCLRVATGILDHTRRFIDVMEEVVCAAG